MFCHLTLFNGKENQILSVLTGRHDRDLSCHHTVQTNVRQSSSHHATRKSEILRENTHRERNLSYCNRFGLIWLYMKQQSLRLMWQISLTEQNCCFVSACEKEVEGEY